MCTFLAQSVSDFFNGAHQFDVFQFIQVLLAPANRPCQGTWCVLHHYLNGPVLPHKESALDPTSRADARMMICTRKPQIELVLAFGTTQCRAVGGADCVPGLLLCSVHWIKSSHGKLGNRCRHLFCNAGERAFQSTMRAGMVVSLSCLIASAR